MPPLHLLIKPSSGMCNLRCKYCFYHDITQKRETENYGFMTTETLENIVEKSFSYAHHSCGFAFQGGEPTLIGLSFFRKFIRFVNKYNVKHLPVQYAIQTNGYCLGEDWAEFLADNRFLVGLSLDGVKASHNAYRINAKGEGTFEQVMDTVDLFNQYHVEYNILTVVQAKTAEKIRRIYEFYKKNHFHYLQFIACLDPIGEMPGQREYSLSPEVYGKFLVELFELWYLDFREGCQPYIRQFENYIAILAGYQPESCEQRGVCGIQHVIEADGSVYPCDFYVMDRYRLGNLNTDDFQAIRQNGMDCSLIQHSMRTGRCQRCRYYFVCRGGCNRHRIIMEDGLPGENFYCRAYQMLFDAALPRMQFIARTLVK